VTRPGYSLIFPLLVVLGACGGSKTAGFDDASTPATLPDGAPIPDDAGIFAGGDVGAPTTGIAVVYGESADTLYRLDPNTKAVTVVGKFDGCTGVLDIALDASSKMYATTVDTLWTIDTATAKCTKIASATTYPNSLSFVPRGTLDPNAEALVGYEGGNYVRLDTTTGSKTSIGKLDTTGKLVSSGDIVSVKGGATYLTVKALTGACKSSDCLIEVNPATGAMVKDWGSVQHNDVFGLAFWAGSVYGFDKTGHLFEVTFKNGVLSTSDLSIPMAPAGLSFYGAGSTTSAPVVPTN
jgi:hypothetical protein